MWHNPKKSSIIDKKCISWTKQQTENANLRLFRIGNIMQSL